MINAQIYISKLISLLKHQYDSRLVYVGLQGSYLREEATDNSDIDIMVVIDGLTVRDLDNYRTIIESLEHSDKSCGFICSKDDLAKWNPLEICHLLHTTKDYYGTLAAWIPAYNEQDIRNFVKISLNNLYHEICHRYIHAAPNKSAEALPFTMKSVFFILQNVFYLRSGQFIETKDKLLMCLEGIDRDILALSMGPVEKISAKFPESFKLVFAWCQETLYKL